MSDVALEPPAAPLYDSVLEGLYQRQMPDALPASLTERFWFDSDRRLLEVSRQLHLHWRLTAAYAAALHGDVVLLDVAATIPALRHSHATLDAAIETAFARWVAAPNGDAVLRTLHRYDEMRRARGAVHDAAVDAVLSEEFDDVPHDYVVASFDVDALQLARLVELYVRQHAPTFMYAGLRAAHRRQVLVAYRRDGSIYAVDLTLRVASLAAGDGPAAVAAQALLAAR